MLRTMKNEYDFKRTIAGVINAINAAEDADKISIYENILVSIYASNLLYIAAISNFLVRYIIYSINLTSCLIDSIIFLILGITYDVITRVNLKTQRVTFFIAILSFLTFIFVAVRFYDIIGPALWTVGFIQLFLAMIRITRTMLYYIIAAILIGYTYILYQSFYGLSFQFDTIYYVIQFIMFLILFIIAAHVHKINIDRYKLINRQLQETNAKKEKITSLYEEIAASEEAIKHIAYHDNLTGLPNRLYFTEQLNHAINFANRTGNIFSIMFLDLDGFKMINDTMGHSIGDELLIKVAQRLVNTLRKTDIVARIGGDEFVVMIENIKNENEIKIVAEKIRECFMRPFVLDEREFIVTSSIGIALFPNDGETAEKLIANADITMYRAKQRGKNQYVFCTPGMKTKASRTMKLTSDLYRALEKNEFELYYQPQVSCTTNEIVGLEALIRWNHPELGMVYPGEFISLAEQNGLIISMGEWVMRTACRQNKAWQDAGYDPIRVGVNISVQQLQNGDIVKQVEDILRETGLKPQYLELEITESIAMSHKRYLETINALKDLGIKIAIDDFGTQYSSLNYLKQLSVDRIKIAMPFIQGISENPKDEAITKTIIILAKSMEMDVIAEGVETRIQLEFLIQESCDEIQGYYFFKPMSSNELEKLLKTGAAQG